MTAVITPAAADAWPDVCAVLGARRAAPDACWCQRFRRHDRATNAEALRAELESGVPVGLLASVDDVPAGWSRVVPRESLPGVTGNRALRPIVAPSADAWWVACVVVRREYRGRGVGSALVAAAIDHARDHGAAVLEGHPVDVGALKGRPSPSALFTGTLSMFLAAGFTEVGRTYPSRPVLRWLQTGVP